MLRGLVVTHGELGAALLAAAEQIVGSTPGVEAMSNADCSGDALREAIAERVDAWGDDAGIVFTDLVGSSCTRAALQLLAGRERGRLRVVTGANLTMLVDFLVNRERCGFEELCARMERKGREGVRLLPASPGSGSPVRGAPSASSGE